MEFLSEEAINQAVTFIKERTDIQPRIGMILGSGLGPLSEEVANGVGFPSEEVP